MAGTCVKMVVVFLGTIREGNAVNRGKGMTAGKLLDAFIFQKPSPKNIEVDWTGKNFTINEGVLSMIKTISL
jgi:hypothetical protein